MKKKSTIIALILCAAMIAGILAGCGGTPNGGGGSEPDGSSGGGTAKDTIVVASQTEPTTLGTCDHAALASDYVNQLIYSGLTRVDENNEMVGDIAESWEQVSDTEWIFHLREDVYFHNGEHLTADDVVATLYWVQGFEASSTYALSFATAIETVDEYTVRIVTEVPVATLLYYLSNHANFIVPKSLIDSGNDFNENPVGCGPYKFVSWDAGEKLTFEAFEDFYEGAPAIQHLTYMIIPESSSRTMALQSGDVDYVIQVNAPDYELLVADENVEVLEKPGTSLNHMMLNNAVAPFNDENFRKAVNAAINKQDIVDGALYGLASPAVAQTPDMLAGTVTTNADEYDVELAKQYMEAWGGNPADATFTVMCSNDTKVKIAEIIQAALSEIGITMKIESCDTAAYLAQTAPGVGEYQAAIGGYNHSSMYNFANYEFLSTAMGGGTRSQAQYEDVDELLIKAGSTVDPEENLAVLEELSATLNDRCIYIPLYSDYNLRAYNKELGGVQINGSNENNWRTLYWKS